ncbi:NADPH:quinone reductase [Amycolatopsis tucumanensis]|uniref:NADPH:quinone reductase n=1 Tax=Amycolatopsis tucumanensis TaxID=401106 RepID=A0ABP7HP83_9PSEU|nr:NADPH:quinone reductase [Amycolatopsis tucumanensis]MCF6421375.1 NADPH:quinone reductase [Amycolatopsis tucumanensis]
MRAAVYTRTGKARDVLRVRDLGMREPGPGEVRVRISLSGINPSDVKRRDGQTPSRIDGFQVPHMDGVGRIDAVGPGVAPGRVGQRVWLWMAALSSPWGTAAEHCVVPHEQAVPLPDHVPDELGASLGVPALTAHLCLFPDGPLQGTDVLVAGGAGAVGHFAIELAKWAGARVATTVSSPAKAELASQAGADLVVNYRTEDAISRIRAFSDGINRVVEVAPAANWELDTAVCATGARIVAYSVDRPTLELPLLPSLTSLVTIRFLLVYGAPRDAVIEAAREVTAAAAAGALTPLPVHSFSLARIAAAHEAVEAGVTGKVIIDLRE